MKKDEFLTILQTEFAQFNSLIEAIGIDRMDQPGISGTYSGKDLLAHLWTYERALVTWLNEARAGRVYVDPVTDHPDLDRRNALIYDANRDRDAEEITADFRQTFIELIQSVRRFSEAELNDSALTSWFVVPRWQQKQALWTCIASDSYEHHHQHIPDVERWLQAHSAQREVRFKDASG